MRWDNLFDDLESQLEAEIESAEQSVHADEERHRQAQLTLQERLRNLTPRGGSGAVHGLVEVEVEAEGQAISLTLTSGILVAVCIMRHGSDWFAVDVISPVALEGHALVPLAAVSQLHPTASQLKTSLGAVPSAVLTTGSHAPRIADSIGLGFVLRDLARRRRTLEIHTLHGVVVGTVDRVGVDHCDIAEHGPAVARREENVRRYRVVALAGITLVRIL
jgi:hypothetical protein